MGIGVFALICAAIMAPFALMGIRYNKPPEKKEKQIVYPYPKEL